MPRYTVVYVLFKFFHSSSDLRITVISKMELNRE